MRPSNQKSQIKVALDTTFSDRSVGGSSVYARSLRGALVKRADVSVRSISAKRAGVAATLRWLQSGAAYKVKHSGADILHCPAFVAPWKTPVPLVVTMHDAAALRFPGEFDLEWRIYSRYFLPAIARRASSVLVGTESSRLDLIRHYKLKPRRVTVTTYGVDEMYRASLEPERIAAERHKLTGGDAQHLLLFSGAPIARKNLDIVMHVMAEAVPDSRLSTARLIITGATSADFPSYREKIAALNLGGRVLWLGQVERERLPLIYSAADVLVYPSLYEGFGLPPLEAMACGTPTVASNAACLPEVLGDAALLLAPNDAEGFCRALERLLTEPDFRARLIEKGKKRAAMFTWERCAEQTAEVYRKVAAD